MQSVHENRIEVNDRKIILKDFTIEEKNIVDFFNRLQHEEKYNNFQLRERFLKLLQMGFLASQSVDVSNRTDFVEKSFQALTHDMQDQIKNNLPEQIKIQMESIIGENGTFMNELRETYGNDGKYSLIIEKMITDYNQTINRVLDITDEKSPFNHLMKVIKSDYNDLFGFIKTTEGKQDIIKSTTKKGEQFEDLLTSILSEACPDFNCEFHDTRTNQGTIGKQGDFLIVDKDTKKKITIEAKNLKAVPKTSNIISLLDECLQNRSADYAIYMYYDDNEVDSIPEPGVFNALTDNKLFLMIDNDESKATANRLVRFACRYALAQLKSTESKDEDYTEKFNQIKDGIQTRCKQIKEIKKHSTKISKISNDLIKDMESDLALLN